MCGICGVAGAGDGKSAVAVDAMRAAIAHRGPDEGATGVFGPAALGIQRLAVIDLAPTGRQPVTNEAGDVAVVFNGELYNFRALRDSLAGRGHDIPGTGDTAVIPHLYEEHGERFVERLEGMFAVALWDARRRRLVLARDRLGKKPLLWTRLADGTLAFASELKALARLPQLDRTVDLACVDAYLALGYVPGERTALAAVRRVPPGHLLVEENGRERLVRYWHPRPAEASHDEREWVERVHDAVVGAVRRRLVADVPLGALLSGGLDSSVVVAAMAQASAEPVRTFSIGFAEERYDERRWARLVAERYGTRHEELVVEPDAAALVPELARAFDEPFADSSALPTYLVCRMAREHVTVALTGDGGDETFAGYERYRAHALAERLGRAPGLARGAARLLRTLPPARREPRSPLFRAARFLDTAGLDAAERYGRLMEVVPLALRERLWSDDARTRIGPLRSAGELLGPPRPPGGLTGLQLLDLETYLPGDLLPKADVASMANSLELRSPLLDHELVELALALPDSLKTDARRGKIALRRAFAADLPAEVLGRGKRGFGVPVARWFRGELRGLASDVLLDGTARGRALFRPGAVEGLLAEHVDGRADHGPRIWSLMMLELWLRGYVDAGAT